MKLSQRRSLLPNVNELVFPRDALESNPVPLAVYCLTFVHIDATYRRLVKKRTQFARFSKTTLSSSFISFEIIATTDKDDSVLETRRQS